MSSTNQGPEYFSAEKKYLAAGGPEERIYWLQEMIRNFKKHKGSEKMLAELKTRLIKFKGKLEKSKKARKGKKGIRKEGYQIVLVGKTNSGKSMLLGKLTHATPQVSAHEFTTKDPELGTMNFRGVRAQVVDLPSVGSKDFDYGIVNNADCLLIVVSALNSLEDIDGVEEALGKADGKKVIVCNKIDKLSEGEKRKLDERFKAKRLKNYVLISASTGDGIEDLKIKIIHEMKVVRVFTKEPGKKKNEDPVVLKEGATVRDVAETIRNGFAAQVREARLTGPSGKFSNQRVGMAHKVKDMDVVEFKT